MANTSGEKELKTNWPVVVGRTAKTTKQTGTQTNLLPQGKLGIKTTVRKAFRKGLD